MNANQYLVLSLIQFLVFWQLDKDDGQGSQSALQPITPMLGSYYMYIIGDLTYLLI